MLYHLGPNPTVDVIVTKRIQGTQYVLLIRRSRTANAEPGKLAFPGGFVDTNSPKGEVWQQDVESFTDAVKRELKEETGLNLSHISDDEFQFLGIYDAPERDPRNSNTAWIASHVFSVAVNEYEGENVVGMDDAEEASWYSIQEIKQLNEKDFAFDHFKILMEKFKDIFK